MIIRDSLIVLAERSPDEADGIYDQAFSNNFTS
jgi:hypothetical protein